MSPVQYLAGAPLLNRHSILRQKKQELQDYDFSLVVDNRPLRKPILLPSGPLGLKSRELEEDFDFHVEPFVLDEIVSNERLRCIGYVYWQRKQVVPSTLRGLEIYIRNVGIGLYDSGLMGFASVNPTSRAGQISAEVYVEEGLERALNVDRNSFRETDAHYLALQQKLWSILGSGYGGEGVLGRSVRSYYARKARADARKHVAHVSTLQQRVRTISGGRIEVVFSRKRSKAPFEHRRGTLTVFENSPAWPRRREERESAQTVLICAKVAIESGLSNNRVLAVLEEILLKPD